MIDWNSPEGKWLCFKAGEQWNQPICRELKPIIVNGMTLTEYLQTPEGKKLFAESMQEYLNRPLNRPLKRLLDK